MTWVVWHLVRELMLWDTEVLWRWMWIVVSVSNVIRGVVLWVRVCDVMHGVVFLVRVRVTSQDPKHPADDPIWQTLFFVCTDNVDRLWKKVCRVIVCRV